MSTPRPYHHILLIGGSGVCGLLFIQAALDAGHQLTLYLRHPSKLPPALSSHPKITVIHGELDDEEGLQRAAACGADTFISFAGPTLGRRSGTPITNALKILYPLLIANASTTFRILVLCTPSYAAPEDKRSFKWFVGIHVYVRGVGGDSYREIKGIGRETVALGNEVDWTLFRVPLLRGDKLEDENEDRELTESFVGDGDGRDALTLDRSALVRWVLREMDQKRWVGKCPLLSNA